MSTSDTDRPGWRQLPVTIFVYILAALFCIVFDRVYALFGHGVRSASMSLMYLYPLLGGALVYSLAWLLVRGAGSARTGRPASGLRVNRFAFNAYNSGIAALTLRSLLHGVFEIAGTTSDYLAVLSVSGWTMVAAGVMMGSMSLHRPFRERFIRSGKHL